MSYRTLVELNHDYCPPNDDEALLGWARSFRLYYGSGVTEHLPRGVTYKHVRHHSDPDPMAGRGDPIMTKELIDEYGKAFVDAAEHGQGFMKDGKHVPRSDVVADDCCRAFNKWLRDSGFDYTQQRWTAWRAAWSARQ